MTTKVQSDPQQFLQWIQLLWQHVWIIKDQTYSDGPLLRGNRRRALWILKPSTKLTEPDWWESNNSNWRQPSNSNPFIYCMWTNNIDSCCWSDFRMLVEQNLMEKPGEERGAPPTQWLLLVLALPACPLIGWIMVQSGAWLQLCRYCTVKLI